MVRVRCQRGPGSVEVVQAGSLNGILDLTRLKFRSYSALNFYKWVYDDLNFGGFSFDESPTGQARVWWPAKG